MASAGAAGGGEPKAGEQRHFGPWGLAWRRYRRSTAGLFGIGIVVLLLVVGLLAPVLANKQPILVKYDGEVHAPALTELLWNVPGFRRLFPKSRPFGLATFNVQRSLEREPEKWGWAIWPPVPHGPNATSDEVLAAPSREHLLGTDEVGRDVLARMVHGARVSMLVGFVSTGIATLIGLIIGALAGFYGGKLDIVLSRIIEIVICFPVFFLILSIMAWFTPSIWNVMIVIGITRWTGIARYVRGEFIRLRGVDFSVAATALGAGNSRIISRHILPNALAPVFVPVSFGIASAILIEAGLSWLGFGVQPPDPSWGNILRTAFDNIFTAPFLVYPPCVAIFLAVLSYNLVGDTLRDVIDPRLTGSR